MGMQNAILKARRSLRGDASPAHRRRILLSSHASFYLILLLASYRYLHLSAPLCGSGTFVVFGAQSQFLTGAHAPRRNEIIQAAKIRNILLMPHWIEPRTLNGVSMN